MEFVLDMSKWRAGGKGNSKCRIGNGDTLLENIAGEMCCLGQFSKQLGYETISANNAYYERPSEIADQLDSKAMNFLCHYEDDFIDINDDEETTLVHKIDSIRKLLKKKRHTLKVVNFSKFGLRGRQVNGV